VKVAGGASNPVNFKDDVTAEELRSEIERRLIILPAFLSKFLQNSIFCKDQAGFPIKPRLSTPKGQKTLINRPPAAREG
jgi:hypothetical protein